MNEKIQKSSKVNVKFLTFSAIMIALSSVLSLIKVVQMPLGGSITLLSMVPICCVSIVYGLGYGVISAFVYSCMQLIFAILIPQDGMGTLLGWGLSGTQLAECIILDYILAYTALGLCGMFRKKGNLGIVAGVILAMFLNFLSHFVSGYVVFTYLEQFPLFGKLFENRPVLYSIAYNAFYMLPETVITSAAIYTLARTKILERLKK
ncbi:MAG: energy-coupled thiamine transporter ThiT [Clostridia bacterium]|nr:energy-coupled thiamine transporter ThiT [Clostridia bacterium]